MIDLELSLHEANDFNLRLGEIIRTGGTSDYVDLQNKPCINNIELVGNKSTSDLNISYNDLYDLPTIPTKTSELDNDSDFVTSEDLAVVAFSGSYTDLEDKPTPIFKNIFGNIYRSSNNSVNGYGSVNITLFSGIARLDFDVVFTSSGSGSSVFTHGISPSALREIDPTLPIITPVQGGNWNITNDAPLFGYGSLFEIITTEHWTPARYYTTSGSVGSYPASEFIANRRLQGVCFGTYQT